MSDTPTRPSFRLESTYDLRGHGTVYSVKLDRDTDDFAHLVGQEIEIDGLPFFCRRVERFAIVHHRVGEMTGLLADPISVPVTVDPPVSNAESSAASFLYDVVVRPPSPEATARFARQVEAIIGRPITWADVDSLRGLGR